MNFINLTSLLFKRKARSYISRYFAAAKMKAERFQNSTSNKSRRERERDTFVGPLLLGYNM